MRPVWLNVTVQAFCKSWQEPEEVSKILGDPGQAEEYNSLEQTVREIQKSVY